MASRYYLDCPSEEKLQAKAMGASWDGKEKQWFVPKSKLSRISEFNRWTPNGNVYLDCPYEEREEAKMAGARWDPTVKRWYVPYLSFVGDEGSFSPWLRHDPHNAIAAVQAVSSSYHDRDTSPSYHDVQSYDVEMDSSHYDMDSSNYDVEMSPSYSSPPKKATTSKSSKSKNNARRGNAADAALLRVNENMTVPQLQEECKVRGIKGYSGKTKEWLLDQLGIGSVWNASLQQSKKVAASEPCAVQKKPPPKKTETKSNKQPPTSKRPPASTLPKSPVAKKPKTEKPKTAPPKASKKVATMDWSSLPRVSTSMTIPQLCQEMLSRDPSAKGMSNKSKSWFLSQLGDGSIWTSCPDVSVDFSRAPRVSKSLTVAQLMHEILSRTPSRSGLSSKNKEELLSIAGIGSIWMTGNA